MHGEVRVLSTMSVRLGLREQRFMRGWGSRTERRGLVRISVKTMKWEGGEEMEERASISSIMPTEEGEWRST